MFARKKVLASPVYNISRDWCLPGSLQFIVASSAALKCLIFVSDPHMLLLYQKYFSVLSSASFQPNLEH